MTAGADGGAGIFLTDAGADGWYVSFWTGGAARRAIRWVPLSIIRRLYVLFNLKDRS